MSTLSHMLPPTQVKRLSLVHGYISVSSEALTEEPPFREETGLGTMRGLVFAVLCDIILAAIAIAGWQLWRLFR
ncbi:hypothetical protein [Alloacidobacterium sp.]|uniref:hypothetical protein n=1 Tax=Alloacidobacterium sp. TaxID=2951999 RepID=UPI002D25DC57|nr:hypothetical protein [Alloacidobacterium sp.]HYK38164.1 hypothetical protein [Alloacidobacterium sp.]